MNRTFHCESPIYLPGNEITSAPQEYCRCRQCGRRVAFAGMTPFSEYKCNGCGAELHVPRPFGDYMLLERISVSDTARVYLAFDPLLDRSVIIKIPRVSKEDESFNQHSRQALYYDAQIQTAVEHPNTLEVYRACLLDNRDFKVMELLPGGKLQFHEDPAERTDPLVVMTAMAEVVAMLGAAYKEKNAPHGNITPDHLLFSDEGRLKLINFRPHEYASPEIIMPQNEFFFAAPERLRDYEISAPADIYSIGVILFMLFTNRHPMGYVDELSELDLLERQLKSPVPPMKNLAPFHDDAIFNTIIAMLAPNPGERPNHDEVAAALRNAAGKMARKRNVKETVTRISQKIQKGIAKFQDDYLVN